MKLVAFCTKGLEEVVEQEILLSISDAQIIKVDTKRVVFLTDAKFDKLVKLRTVDDLGFVVGELVGVGEVEGVIGEVGVFDLEQVRRQLKEFKLVDQKSFSLTVSLVGVKFRALELVKSLSEFIHEYYGWEYQETDRSQFDIRVFLDHRQGVVAVRLAKESLQNRDYKQFEKLGSLKPTIAAAMVRLAIDNLSRTRIGIKVIDNFCGSGTILAEALSLGNEIYGGDIDPESVQNTWKNLKYLGFKGEEVVKVLDAQMTNWPKKYFDCAISNLPWDKQIKTESITTLYINTLCEYQRIVKDEGVVCLLVSKPELLVKYAKEYFPNKKITTYPIGLLGQNPTIVVVA